MTFEAELLFRVANTINKKGLFRPSDTLVVGVSGGADSTALLDILAKLPDYNLKLIVAHLNHCLRAAESDADEQFCRELAASYKIPFESRRVDVNRTAAEGRLSLEDAGRRVRIDFFDEIRIKYGATTVILAHHADDQAETILMHLLRGSGTTGLSGMAYKNDRDYVRPLLDVSRYEIEQYLRCCSLNWRDDSSNIDAKYLRNRIRHELLPVLKTYNPDIRSSLSATAKILGDDEELLAELTRELFSTTCKVEERRILCDIARLRSLKRGMLNRILRYAFRQLTGTLELIGKRHIDAICGIIESDRPNSRLTLPHQVLAIRDYDQLSLVLQDYNVYETDFELLINGYGYYELPNGTSISVEAVSQLPTYPGTDSACFDLTKTPFPWTVRTFRSGDRIMPFGMTGRKKVKNLFIDRKVPLSERKRIPLFFCGEDLIYIAGVCTSEICRYNGSSATLVLVKTNN